MKGEKKKSRTRRHSKAVKYQGKEKTEWGIMAKQRTQRNSSRKKTPSKIVQRKQIMTIRIQAKPPTEKQTSKERKPKQSEKAMKPCKMQCKGMKGKPKSKAKQQKKQEEERKGTEKERKLTISHSIRRERGRKKRNAKK